MRARQGSQRKSERPQGAEIAAESPARRGRPTLTQTETTYVPGTSKEDAAGRNPCRARPHTSQLSQPRKKDRWVLGHRSAETTLKYKHPADAMVGRERMRLTDAAIARLRPRAREYTVTAGTSNGSISPKI